MIEKYVVTTAIEETWPKDKEKIIFLGEWCKLHSRKKYWEDLDFEVLDYHWNDRQKLENDYKYLIDLHERVLKIMVYKMNDLHEVNYNMIYWRILIGPWLGTFIQTVFDRWEMIQSAIKSNYKLQSISLEENYSEWIPKDTDDFYSLLQLDGWNSFIYNQIIKIHRNNFSTKKIKIKNTKKIKSNFYKSNFKEKIFQIYQFFAKKINSNNSSLVITSYLGIIDELKLSIRLKQFPLLLNFDKVSKIYFDENKRKWKLDFDSKSSFENFLIKLIPFQIPKIYIEGFKKLVEKSTKLNWPKKPISIFTSNSMFRDEIFKHYAGENVEKKIPLIIAQHGGHYGLGKIFFSEYHELSISSKYISWGWNVGLIKSRIYPLGSFSSKRAPFFKTKKTKLLISTVTYPRYSYSLASEHISTQWLSYFKDQIIFINKLIKLIRDSVIVKLYPIDNGWNQIERWKDIFPDLVYDTGNVNIQEHYSKTKLYLVTYNSTVFLDCFRLDFPTVIFWDPNYCELRDSAKSIFKDLKKVKVFHESPDSAAKHVNEIWDDVLGWWKSEEVLKAIEKFNNNYNKGDKDLVYRLSNILQQKN